MLTVAQIYAVLALLLAFNVPQTTVNNVQAILEASSSVAVASTMLQDTGQLKLSTSASVPTCIENPKLDFGYSMVGNSYLLKAIYTTGCPLNRETAWRLKVPSLTNGSCNAYDYGTLSKRGCYMNGWDFQDTNTAVFEGNADYATTTTVVLTVGDLSATTTVPGDNR